MGTEQALREHLMYLLEEGGAHLGFDEAVADCKGPVEDEPLDCHDWYDKAKSAADRAKHPTPLTEQQIISLRRRAPCLNQPVRLDTSTLQTVS